MDTTRVVLHIDIDAFYAQCEELQDPSLRLKPLGALLFPRLTAGEQAAVKSTHPAPCFAGVTQKYLIVTANYPARSFGVSKLMGIKDAQQRCPELVLISGEDLTPYRWQDLHVMKLGCNFRNPSRQKPFHSPLC